MRKRNARHQRHIGGADAAVGKIDRGRRLRGTGYPDQHHVRLLQPFDMLAVIMHHRIVQRVDALEIFRVQDVLRADPPGSRGSEIGLEQLHHRTDDRQARDVDLLALGFEPDDEVPLEQGKQYDSRRLLDFIQYAVELLLAAHQRIDMFHRRHIGILRGHRARDRDQGFTGRIGNQMKVKIIA